MVDLGRPTRTLGGSVLIVVLAAALPSCSAVPGSRLDESQRLVQSLRAENARLKDQALGLEVQNRDYADRAVDDLRRLTARDQAIERLERSVQAYQGDRDRLVAAYRRLATGLERPAEDTAMQPTAAPHTTGASNGSATRGQGGGEPKSEHLSSSGDGDGDGGWEPAPASRTAP